nr:TPA_asm: hypothetical protein HUJ06_023611 [Nelumbo nucifera]
MTNNNLHVVIVPWLAFGHLIPFLQLSMALAKAGIRVSFISTPRNVQRLPKVPPNLAALVRFVELRLPTVEGLPLGAEATVDVSMDEIQHLKTAYDLLRHQVKQFVANESPDWIIQDFIPFWVAEIAREYGVPLITFSVYSAATLGFHGPLDYLTNDGHAKYWTSPESMMFPPEWVTFPSSVAFRRHEANAAFAGFFGQNASSITDNERVVVAVEACQAVAIRSCTEYEPDYLNLVEKIWRRPVIPVGLLPPAPSSTEAKEREGEWGKIFKWLDGEKPRTVVFVAFGSECKLSRDQVYEIAHGLELSNLPFLWALRKPTWAVDEDDALPSEFRRRTEGRGVVCMGWAPQLEILGHPSIGGSLFHSGWGSIIETLQHGHALVVLPFVADQGLNARQLVEKGLAVEVERSEEDGRFEGSDVAEALKKVMVDEGGESLRARAASMRAVFGDVKLHQDHYIGGLVQYLQQKQQKQQQNKSTLNDYR